MENKHSLAPIVVFAFNRLEPLKACISSLLANTEAVDSDLIVFVDGPRANKEGEKEKVEAVREYVKTIAGFKSLSYHFSEKNKKLGPSIIAGVTEIINEYGKAIVVEDDLYLASSFLSYMNKMLAAFENDKRIMQITGYSAKINNYKQYHTDIYMTRRAHSWSWATWKDRWNSVDWEVKDFDELAKSRQKQKAFCEYGSDLFGMLKGWKEGRNQSWFIRFNYSMHKQSRYSIAPIRSLVRNDGFGEDATNCKTYNRYKIDFMGNEKKEWNIPQIIEWHEDIDRVSVRYWTLHYRIYGKLMTFLARIFPVFF